MRDDDLDLDRIERRITAVGSVRQVVSAIWALARAQLPHVEQATADAATYLGWVDRVVERLAGAPRPDARRSVLTVVFGPERHYCGGLPRAVAEQVPVNGELAIVGQRLWEVLEHEPSVATRTRFVLPGATTPDDAEAVAQSVAERVLQVAHGRAVEVLSPQHGTSTLHRVRLLGGERQIVGVPPETLTTLPEVLTDAVSESASSWLTVVAMQTLHAEVRARLAAADAARTACDRQLDELRDVLRVARQESITAELLEVVAGNLAGDRTAT